MSSESFGQLVHEVDNGRGFKHRYYIMYHATAARNVDSILASGFRPSAGGTLGPGVYVSRDPNKAAGYGEVTFRLLVYAGKTTKVGGGGSGWQGTHSSAWLPASALRREENCLRSPRQIRVLGVAAGWDKVGAAARAKTRDRSGAGRQLDEAEKAVLKEMIKDIYKNPI